MIALDSPVETVLGEAKDKRSTTRNQRIVETLGLATVGDLLHHFPRRYVETGAAHRSRRPREGPVPDGGGRDRQLQHQHLQGPPDPPPGLPRRRDGPHREPLAADVVLRQAPGDGRLARQADARRPARHLPRPGRHLPRRVAADPPADGAVRRAGRGHGAALAGVDRRLLPDLPAHQGRRVVGPPARHHLRPDRGRRAARAAARRRPATARRARRTPGARLDPRPGHVGPDQARPAPLPLRGGAGHPARPRAAPSRGARDGSPAA